MSKQQLPRAIRTAQLLDAALDCAENHGIWKMRRDDIALKCGVTMALVTLYLGTMVQIQRSVIRQAIRTRRIPVIAEALARSSCYVRDIPQDLRDAAAAYIAGG